MTSSPPQRFERAEIFAVDARDRRVLVVNPALQLVDLKTGDSRALPRLEIPAHHHQATQDVDAWSGAASWRALALRRSEATMLTTEGVWRLDVDKGDAWARLAGHPTDPPAGWTVEQARQAGYAATYRGEGYHPRLGSHPVALSADGSTVVGAPNLRGVIASEYELHLASQRLADAPIHEAPRLRRSVEALAVSADGSAVAFSEGRDLRVLTLGQKRARQLSHPQGLLVRSLSLSHDGKFAAASGIFPNDPRTGPLRAVLWEVETRNVLAEWPCARQLGFIRGGNDSVLVLADVESAARTELVAISDLRVVHVLEGRRVRAVQGTLDFLAVLDAEKVLTVDASRELQPAQPRDAAAAPGADATGWEKLKAEAANVNHLLFLYPRIQNDPHDTALVLDAMDRLCAYALFVDPEGVATPTLWQLFEPILTSDHLGTLAALTLAECNGWASPGDAIAKSWPRLGGNAPSPLLDAALVAWGRFEDFERIGGARHGAVSRVAAHVVSANRDGRTPELMAAWTELLASAADLIDAGEVRICELMLLARAIRVELGGETPAQSFAWLREQIEAAL